MKMERHLPDGKSHQDGGVQFINTGGIMRLDILEEGRGLRPIQRLLITILKKTAGNFMPPPVIVMSYNRHLFGKPFAEVNRQALRQTTYWSKAEAELMAAFVSRKNSCRY